MRLGRPLGLGSGYRLAALGFQPPRSGPGARSESRLVVLNSPLTAARRAWGVCQRRVSATGHPRANCRVPSHQCLIDRDESRDGLFKNVASPEPAEQLLVDALGEVAVDPLDEVLFLRYTRDGEASEGGDRGHQDSQANEDGPGNRKGAQERDLGLPETSAGGYAGSSPNSSKRNATSKRTRVTRVN